MLNKENYNTKIQTKQYMEVFFTSLHRLIFSLELAFNSVFRSHCNLTSPFFTVISHLGTWRCFVVRKSRNRKKKIDTLSFFFHYHDATVRDIGALRMPWVVLLLSRFHRKYFLLTFSKYCSRFSLFSQYLVCI